MNKHVFALALMLALGTAYAATQGQDAFPVGPSGSPTMNPATSQGPTTSTDHGRQAPFDDQTLTSQLHQQFDTDIAFKNVQIAVTDGKVDLTGSVASKEDRKRAKEMAQAVPGVRSVREHLTIEAPVGSTTMQGQTGTSASTTTDASVLKSQLDSAFQSDPALSSSHVMVNVTDTTIELTGSVPSSKERLTAKRIAQSYAGNRKVDDKLTVTGSGSGSGSNPNSNPPASSNENPKTQNDQSSPR